ncbi:MAG: hypothetical protein L0221_07645, partial [Chloroflexi bacterium]|nr:hypothetical protein [Chloroflexota bacterium]
HRTDASISGVTGAGDPQLTTPSIGRADVWVFDANAPGAALGGTPITTLTLLGDTPRALAASPDGSTVYAAAFHSGNRTTTVAELVVTANGGLPPPPPGATPGAPPTGLVVRFDPATGQWRDEINRNWASFVPFSLPDQDVFVINANATPPVQTAAVSGVGTVLFNMAVRPDNGKLYVSNTEARNEVRFEPLITGNLVQSRITVVTGLAAAPRHLNPHIAYGVVPGPAAEVAQTLAFPTGMVFSPNGLSLYLTAFGSRKVGVLDTTSLEAGSIVADQVEVGGGPTGLALDAARDRLYVLNRFDQTISIVTHASLGSLRAQTGVVPLRFDPSPQL